MTEQNPHTEGNEPQDSIEHLDFEAPAVEELTEEELGLVAQAQADAASHLSDLQRLNAEYVNFRNRSKREQEAARTRGIEDVLSGMLPVLDDITRARDAGDLDGPFLAISEKLSDALAKFGIEAFGAVGEEFDPMLHEALMHQESAEATSTTITTLIETGYKIGDRVVRAARVAVTGPQG